MPKNKRGGNKAKKQASKNCSEHTNFKLRLSEDPNEIYACVIRTHGSNAHVLCNDGIGRLLIIRKKFRGRNISGNRIGSGTIVLAGLREYEIYAPGKKVKVDLLYVYSTKQERELRKKVKLNPKFKDNNGDFNDDDEDGCGYEIDDNFRVSSNVEEECNIAIASEPLHKKKVDDCAWEFDDI